MRALLITPAATVTEVSLPPSDNQAAIRDRVESTGPADQGVYHPRTLLHVRGHGQAAGLDENHTAWALASAWRGMPMYPFHGLVLVTGRTRDGETGTLDDALAQLVHTVAETVRDTLSTWRARAPPPTRPPAGNSSPAQPAPSPPALADPQRPTQPLLSTVTVNGHRVGVTGRDGCHPVLVADLGFSSSAVPPLVTGRSALLSSASAGQPGCHRSGRRFPCSKRCHLSCRTVPVGFSLCRAVSGDVHPVRGVGSHISGSVLAVPVTQSRARMASRCSGRPASLSQRILLPMFPQQLSLAVTACRSSRCAADSGRPGR